MIANAGVAINRVLHESARPDIFVFVAVKLTRRYLAPTEELDRLLDINVKGTFFSYKYAAIQLIKQGNGGRIIGAASVAGKNGRLDFLSAFYIDTNSTQALQA